MARRLTRSTAARMHVRRGTGRPRKNRTAEAPEALTEAQSGPIGIGSNVTDETRLAFLERGRVASAILEEAKTALNSAHKVYSTIIKDARRAGATEIAWTLQQLRRDPLEIAVEIRERNRMLKLAKIDVGTQLGLFEGHDETIADRVARQAAEQERAGVVTVPGQDVSRETVEIADEPKAHASVDLPGMEAALAEVEAALFDPPKPGPDEDEESEDEPEDEEPEEDEEQQVAGNEVLERSEEDQNAYLMGTRSFKLGRTLEANPFKDVFSTHHAWIRGWKSEEARGS